MSPLAPSRANVVIRKTELRGYVPRKNKKGRLAPPLSVPIGPLPRYLRPAT